MIFGTLFAFALAAASALPSMPWVGDGSPVQEGVGWYADDPAPEFRAKLALKPGVREVKVRFACAGFGWFSLGKGAFMNADGLDTLWSVYDKTVYVHTFTAKADEIGDAVTVRLGNGFYNLPPLLFWGSKCFRTELAHGRPCFKLEIEDLAQPLVWQWRKTNVMRNAVYLGAEVDATRAEDTNWKPAAAVKGPKGELIELPPRGLAMGTVDIHSGTSKWLSEGAVQVVDFGVNASGVPNFTFSNEARGTCVEIVYGERLNPDGTVNVLTQTAGQIKRGNGGPGAPHVACQRDAYVCAGLPDECFSPPFTWHICRYAEIRGAKHLVRNPSHCVRSMVSTRTGLAPAAKDFRTNDATLQAIHAMCQRTFQANLIGGVQSDCPGRERLGYGGDIVATCEAMCLNFDMKEIYLKILRDFADEAADDGWITETAPYVGIADSVGLGRAGKGRGGPISWSLAVPVLMDTLLRHYPEAADRILAFYPTCSRYVELMVAAHPSGLVPNCIGDHEALERAPNDCTATAHWYEFVRLTATFARRLNKTEDAMRFAALAEKIKTAFQAQFVKTGVVANGTQSAQAIALYLGLVPTEHVAAAEARLLKAIEEKDFAPTTGIFSTRYLLLYLSTHGYADVARKIVMHKGFSGWVHMLDCGATTLWETWKESDDGYSNCHPMFGSVDEWILTYAKNVALPPTVVPLGFPTGTDPEVIIQAARGMHAKSGISRYVLHSPGHTVRLTGYYDAEGYRGIGRKIKKIQDAVAKDGIEIGFLMGPTMNVGINHPWQKLTFKDGTERAFTACAGDPAFQTAFAERCGALAAECKPFLFMMEDDYGQWGGCFCARHLQRFSQRTGRAWTREALASALGETTNAALRRAWNDFYMADLVRIAELSERAIHAASPATRVGLSASWCVSVPDNARIARALAGPGRRGLVRWGDTAYGYDVPMSVSELLFKGVWAKENVSEGLDCYYEADACPNTPFYGSGARLGSCCSSDLAAGFEGLWYWAGNPVAFNAGDALPGLNEFARSSARWAALHDAVKGGRTLGPSVSFNPNGQLASLAGATKGHPCDPPAFARLLGRMGFCYTAREDASVPRCFAGYWAFEGLSDTEVEKLLSGSAFLDGEAAEALTDRGLSHLIGVKATRRTKVDFTGEYVPATKTSIRSSFHQNYGLDNAAVLYLASCGAQALSNYISGGPENVVQPALTRFTNAKGGRVVAMAVALAHCSAPNVYNFRKRDLLLSAFAWLGGQDVFPVRTVSDVNAIVTANETEKGLVVHVANLVCDVREALSFEVSEAWRGASVEILDGALWRPAAEATWKGSQLTVPARLILFDTLIIRLKK